MGTTETIVIGVITGMLSAGILFIGNKLIQDSLIPWYKATMYKGIKLSGQSLYTTIFLINGFQQQGDIAICLSD